MIINILVAETDEGKRIILECIEAESEEGYTISLERHCLSQAVENAEKNLYHESTKSRKHEKKK